MDDRVGLVEEDVFVCSENIGDVVDRYVRRRILGDRGGVQCVVPLLRENGDDSLVPDLFDRRQDSQLVVH